MSRKVVEELCQESDCQREGTHWHPLTVESLLAESPGEYTITVRVRVKKKGKLSPKRQDTTEK